MWPCCISEAVIKISLTGCGGLEESVVAASLRKGLQIQTVAASGNSATPLVSLTRLLFLSLVLGGISAFCCSSHGLRLFQATISGPRGKNNSLHGNIPLVKVDAATDVWTFQWRRESLWAFPHLAVCYTFTTLSCLLFLFLIPENVLTPLLSAEVIRSLSSVCVGSTAPPCGCHQDLKTGIYGMWRFITELLIKVLCEWNIVVPAAGFLSWNTD